jgi:hypothetical protein
MRGEIVQVLRIHVIKRPFEVAGAFGGLRFLAIKSRPMNVIRI